MVIYEEFSKAIMHKILHESNYELQKQPKSVDLIIVVHRVPIISNAQANKGKGLICQWALKVYGSDR